MTELARDKPDAPKPPRIGILVAAALELAMVTTFALEHSAVGLLLAASYAYFSATWALLLGAYFDDSKR